MFGRNRRSSYGLVIILVLLGLVQGVHLLAKDGKYNSTQQLNLIQGKLEYNFGELVRLEVSHPLVECIWIVEPNNIDRADTAPNKLQFTAPPGLYNVYLVYRIEKRDNNSPSLGLQTAVVKIVDKRAPPDNRQPPPKPDKPLPPKPDNPQPPAPNPPDNRGKLDPINSVCRIQFGNAGCSATVIGPRRDNNTYIVLTAAHCIPSNIREGKLTVRDGSFSLKVFVRAIDRQTDCAWLVTEPTQRALAYSLLAEQLPPKNGEVWHCGFGFDKPGNVEKGYVLDPETNGQTRFMLSVSSGDSGGGIFYNDRVISCVCCTTRIAGIGNVWGASILSILKLKEKLTDSGEVYEIDSTESKVPNSPNDDQLCSVLRSILQYLVSKGSEPINDFDIDCLVDMIKNDEILLNNFLIKRLLSGEIGVSNFYDSSPYQKQLLYGDIIKALIKNGLKIE